MRFRVRILGCGHSGGLPQFGGDWGECDPAEPKNRRFRSSVAIEGEGGILVIDASPDFRAQALAAGMERVEALLLTHAHADHINGLDEFRVVSWRTGGRVPVFGDRTTLETVRERFSYAFRGVETGGYEPFLDAVEIETGRPFEVAGLRCVAFRQEHGAVHSLGARIGAFAYSTDVRHLPPEAMEILRGVGIWVVGCLGRQDNPRHAHLEQVLAWVDELRPERTVLTHMGPSLDYAELRRVLPKGVEPAYDGMVLDELAV